MDAVFTVILAVAIAVERLVEVVKPLYLNAKNSLLKRNDEECTKTEKIVMTILISPALCVIGGIGINIPRVPAIVQQVLCGLVASIGSNAIHAILGLIVAFKDAAENLKKDEFNY